MVDPTGAKVDSSMLKPLLRALSVDMGIDLGTRNTLVCVRGRGITLCEPSVVAVRRNTDRVLRNGEAVGTLAQDMIGKAPGSISVIRPMKDGVIAEFEIATAMIRCFLRKANGRRSLVRPRLLVGVPLGITEVEKQAIYEAAQRAGAGRVYLVPEPTAAAVGAGLPIADPRGSMVVDIGGGTTEVAILSLADISVGESLRVAGDSLDEALAEYLKRSYGLLVGPRTAERVKIEIGAASNGAEQRTMEVKGRDSVSGLPRTVIVGSAEIREALSGPVELIAQTIVRTLGKVEPELAGDIALDGICLVGGGAMLRGLDGLLHEVTGLNVRIAEDPLRCVALGMNVFLENIDEWGETLESDHDR